MKKERMKLFRHSILAFIILVLLGSVVPQILGSAIAMALPMPIEYALPVAAVPLSLLLLLIHKLNFRPAYKGAFAFVFPLGKMGLLTIGLCVFDMLITFVPAYLYCGVVTLQMTEVAVAVMAGITEEIGFRALPVSILMRNSIDKGHDRIWPIAIATSIAFGFTHILNVFSGGPVWVSLLQALFTITLGLVACGLFLRTGNVLLPMVWHFVHDVAVCFLGAFDQAPGGGSDTASFGTGDFISLGIMVLLVVVYLIVGIKLLQTDKHEKIIAVWKKRWSMEE